MGNVARLQQNFSKSRKNKPFRENAPIKKFLYCVMNFNLFWPSVTFNIYQLFTLIKTTFYSIFEIR